jgi:hypothetical protein
LPSLSSASGSGDQHSNGSPALDRYGQPIAPATNGSNLWADSPSQSVAPPLGTATGGLNNPFGANPPTSNSASSSNPFGANQPGLGQSGFGSHPPAMATANQPVGSMPTLGVGNGASGMNGQPLNPDQLPWIPLLVASVSLAGSLGANFYLGWSYADARHRYHLLVRKTTESFHKAAAA